MKLILNICIGIIFLYPQLVAAIICPSLDTLETNKKWIIHTGRPAIMQRKFEKHLTTPLAPVKVPLSMSLVPVTVDRGRGSTQWMEIIWVVQRSHIKITEINGRPSCYVMGSVAFYVEYKNKDGWPPHVMVDSELEKQLVNNKELALIELRWFDPVKIKRHQWYNKKLAIFMQWVEPKSPIQIPASINCLF